MCLDLGTNKPKMKRATKDIVVYKVIKENGDGLYKHLIVNGKYEPWKKGFQYFEPGFRKLALLTEELSFWDGNNRVKYYVEGNAFHSCKTKEEAESRRASKVWNIPLYIIVKMKIPKWAYYYENGCEYASSSLIY